MNEADPSTFFLAGGPTGALLIHGFPGSTTDVRLPGTYLHERGLTVSAPLLPGHGTQPADLNRVRWQDWVTCAEEALAQLEARCEQVFVGGLSLGSLIAISLAAHHPELNGLILFAPALAIRNKLIHLTPLLKFLVPFWPPGGMTSPADPQAVIPLFTYPVHPTRGAHEVYKLTRIARRLLPQVTAPTLIVYSTRDQELAPHSAQMTYERIGSTDKELVALHHSPHNVLVNAEWETAAAKAYAFVEAHR